MSHEVLAIRAEPKHLFSPKEMAVGDIFERKGSSSFNGWINDFFDMGEEYKLTAITEDRTGMRVRFMGDEGQEVETDASIIADELSRENLVRKDG